MDLNLEQVNGITTLYNEMISYLKKNPKHEAIFFTYGEKENVKKLSKNLTVYEIKTRRYNIPYYPDYPLFCFFKPKKKLLGICKKFMPQKIITVTPTVWRSISSTGIDVGKKLGLKIIGDYQTHIIKYNTYYMSKLIKDNKLSFSSLFGKLCSLIYYYKYKNKGLENNFLEELRIINNKKGINKKVLLGSYFASQIRTLKYNECDIVLVPNEGTKSYLLPLINKDKILLFPKGINTHKFNPKFRSNNFIKKHSLDNKKVFLYAGRISIEKNIDYIIESYMKISKRIDSKLIIVGDGPYKRELEKKHLDVIFTGHLKGKELSQAYASSDFFLYTSETEVFKSCTYYEAMASGPHIIDLYKNNDYINEALIKLKERRPNNKIQSWEQAFDFLFGKILYEIQ